MTSGSMLCIIAPKEMDSGASDLSDHLHDKLLQDLFCWSESITVIKPKIDQSEYEKDEGK
jgi:hypothetical protein